MNKPGTSPRSTYEEQSDWVVPFLLFVLMLMGEAWRYGGRCCLLLTPLFIPGRIDFPWKLSDVKGLLALWCQHSVIPLSVFLNIISGTLFSPFSLVVLIFSPFYLSSLFTLHLLMPPVFPFQLLFWFSLTFSHDFPLFLKLLARHWHHDVIYKILIKNRQPLTRNNNAK